MNDAAYKILGAEMQFVEMLLGPGDSAVGEAGSLFFMQDGITLETILGDGSKADDGILNTLFDAGKRALGGATLFTTVYTNQTPGTRVVAFAAPYPGKIIALDLGNAGGAVICRSESFLCAERGARITVALQKRLGAAFFGGSGFLMQRIESNGTVFFHAGGMVVEHVLKAGETLKAESGSVVAHEPSVDFDIAAAGGLKTRLFGGQGLFLATLRGPGRVWLQSMPFSKLAALVLAAAPHAAGPHEAHAAATTGSVVGSVVGGLINLASKSSDDD